MSIACMNGDHEGMNILKHNYYLLCVLGAFARVFCFYDMKKGSSQDLGINE